MPSPESPDSGSTAPGTATSPLELLRRLRAEQRRRHLAGDRVHVEEFLRDQPTIAADPELLLVLVYGEFLLRRELGDPVTLDDYEARFPSLKDRLRAQHELHAALASTIEPRPESRSASDGPLVEFCHDWPSVPGFRIEGDLGRGGMGVVYLARQEGLDRLVALKMLHPGVLVDDESLLRFQVEAEAIARLNHPNIVQVHAVGESRGVPYLALEHVEGPSLAQILAGKPLPAREAARLARALAVAIAHAHDHQVIHRDLKPSNILFDRQGIPKVSDFGLAKRLDIDSSRTTTGSIVGTPSYMAPEQAAGRAKAVGPAADIHALGAVLYEMLTGGPPFRGSTMIETLDQVRSVEPVPPRRIQPRLPVDLETICLKSLEKEPRKRYGSARELAEELDRFLEHRPIRARRIGPLARGARWCRRNPQLAAALGLALLAGGGLLALLIDFAIVQHGSAVRLAEALTLAREQRRRASDLAASAMYDIARGLCEQGDVDRGLLQLAESLRTAEAEGTGPTPLSRVVRATIADWLSRSHRLQACFEHGSPVDLAVLSPDSGLAATAGRDRTVQLWNTDDGRRLATLPHPDLVRALSFARDGDLLLTASGNAARLWDGRTGALRNTIELDSKISAARFHPGGRLLALAGANGNVALHDALSGRRRGPILAHEAPVALIGFRPDGQVLVTVGRRGTLRRWDVATGRPIGEPIPTSKSPVTLALSPDSAFIMLGDDDGLVQLWDAETGTPVGPPMKHDAAVEVADFSPDGQSLATGSRDWRARVWALSRRDGPVGEPIVLKHAAPVSDLHFADGGARLVVGCRTGQTLIWDLRDRAVRHVLPQRGEVFATAVGQDGRRVLAAGHESVARLWAIPDRLPEGAPIPERDYVYQIALSPDRALVATAGDAGHARVWERSSGRLLGQFAHKLAVRAVAFAPDGRALFSASDDGSAARWDLASSTRLGVYEHGEMLDSVAVGPDGRLLLTGGRTGKVTLWEVETGRKLAEKALHESPILALAISPDGRSFATASVDQTARVARLESLEPITPPLRHQSVVWSVAFRPDGQAIVTGGDDKTIRSWHVRDGRPLAASILHGSPVRSVAFGFDPDTVLAGTTDAPSRIWNLPLGMAVGAPLVTTGGVLAIVPDPAHHRFLAASEGIRIRPWDLPRPAEGATDQVIARVQARIGVELHPGGIVELLQPAAWQARVQAADRHPNARGP